MFRSSNKKQQLSVDKSADSKELSPNKGNNKKSNMQSQQQQLSQVAASNNEENITNNKSNKSENSTKKNKKFSEIVGKHEGTKVTNEKSPRVEIDENSSIQSKENIPSKVMNNSATNHDADGNIIINNNDTSSGNNSGRFELALTAVDSGAQLDNEKITQANELQIDQVKNDDDGQRKAMPRGASKSTTTANEKSEMQSTCNNKNDNSPNGHGKSLSGQSVKEGSEKLSHDCANRVSSNSSMKRSSVKPRHGEGAENEVIYDNCDINQEKCNKTANITKLIAYNSKGSKTDADLNLNDDAEKNVDLQIDKIECSAKLSSKEAKKISRDELKRIEKEAKKLRKQLAKESKKLSRTAKAKNAKKLKDCKQTNNNHIKDNTSNNKENKEVKPMTQSQQTRAEISSSPSQSISASHHRDRYQQQTSRNEQKQKLTADKTTIKELKLFQDHKLINQLDPIEDLKKKLNALNNRDNFDKQQQKGRLLFTKNQSHPSIENDSFIKNNVINNRQPLHQQNDTDESPIYDNKFDVDTDQHLDFYDNLPVNQLTNHAHAHDKELIKNRNANDDVVDDDDFTTIKKGVLWVHQNYDKLSSKIFARWKKRYFILTADYFVCFKRSQSKVGHSEMGSFIYKASLSDITKICWLKGDSNKKERGPLVMHIRDKPNMLLWSKVDALDEWHLLTGEAIKRSKLRRACHQTLIENTQQQQRQQQLAAPDTTCNMLNGSNCLMDEQQQLTSSELYENSTNQPTSSLNETFESPLAKPLPLPPTSDQTQRDHDNAMRDTPAPPKPAARSSTSPSSENQISSETSKAIASIGSGGKRDSQSGQVSRERNRDIERDVGATAANNQAETTSDCNQQRRQDLADKDLAGENNDVERQQRQNNDNGADNCDASRQNCDVVVIGSEIDRSQAHVSVAAPEPPPRKCLIRRDDSWQSLVSLNRISGAHNVARVSATPQHSQKQHPLDVIAKRSIFASKQTASESQAPSTPSQRPYKMAVGQLRDSTCQRKLHQLQLLQQRNQQSQDYQIYEGADTSFQHYGQHFGGAAYSSMRSNLMTATSEFAFIRPSFSNQRQQQHDSTLNSRRGPPITRTRLILSAQNGNQITQQTNQTINRSNLEQKQTNQLAMINHTSNNQNNSNLINQEPQSVYLSDIKPNKKRVKQPSGRHSCETSGQQIPKSSSLTSSIASFFKRAFSGRGRRRKGQKDDGEREADSVSAQNFCTVSLGDSRQARASGEHLRSAFSTGGKNDTNQTPHSMQLQLQANCALPIAIAAQSPRMVDMIEAFQQNTRAAVAEHELQPSKVGARGISRAKLLGSAASPSPAKFPDQKQMGGVVSNCTNHLASPLHKSNSVSVTLNCHQQQPPQMSMVNNLLLDDFVAASEAKRSPLLVTRPESKQMSLNCSSSNNNNTPIMSRKSANSDPNNGEFREQDNLGNVLKDYQPMVQPRRHHHHQHPSFGQMPRPSSIYGQPSLIASPSMQQSTRSGSSQQRNSLVGFPSNQQLDMQNGVQSSIPLRIRPNSNDFTPTHKNASNGFIDTQQPLQNQQYQQQKRYLEATCELREEESPTRDQFPESIMQQSESNFMIDHQLQLQRDVEIKRNSYFMFDVENQQQPSNRLNPSIASSSSCSPLIVQNNLAPDGKQQYRTRQAAIVTPILQKNCANTVDQCEELGPFASAIYDNHPNVMASNNIRASSNRASIQDFVLHHSSQDEQLNIVQQHSYYDNHHAPCQRPVSRDRLQQQQQNRLSGSNLQQQQAINQHSVDPYTIRQLNTVASIGGASPLNHRNDESDNKPHRALNESPSISQFRHRHQMINSSPLMDQAPRRSATNSMLSDHSNQRSANSMAIRNNVPDVPPYPFRSPLIAQQNNPAHRMSSDSSHNSFNSPRLSSHHKEQLSFDQPAAYYDNQSTTSSPHHLIINGMSNNTNTSRRTVVNIAGAPGINLDPVLAASLLEGTQIDAYQSLKISPSIDNYQQEHHNSNLAFCNDANNNNTNKFLVSDRVSKSIANRISVGNAELCNLASIDNDPRLQRQINDIGSGQGWNSPLSNEDQSSSAASSSSMTTNTNKSSTARNAGIVNSSSRGLRRIGSTTTASSNTTNTDKSQDDQSSHHSTSERKYSETDNKNDRNRIQSLKLR